MSEQGSRWGRLGSSSQAQWRYRALRAGLAVALGVAIAPGLARGGTVNGIAAVVNEDIVTEADVQARLRAVQQGAPPAADATERVNRREAVLRQLIQERVMLQEAKRAGIAVASNDILERLEVFRAQAGSEEAFQAWLIQSGLSLERLKEQIRHQLMIRRVIDAKVRSSIVVSPQEVAQELAAHPEQAKSGDRMLVWHLLVRVYEERTEDQARRLIEEIRGRLGRGEPFDALARRYAEDQYREQGGVMGWVAQGDLMPELDSALGALAPGALSEPIRTRLGFHLMRVEQRRPSEQLTLAEANRSVHQRLFQEKFDQAFARWMSELMRKAYVEIAAAQP